MKKLLQILVTFTLFSSLSQGLLACYQGESKIDPVQFLLNSHQKTKLIKKADQPPLLVEVLDSYVPSKRSVKNNLKDLLVRVQAPLAQDSSSFFLSNSKHKTTLSRSCFFSFSGLSPPLS